MIRRYIQIYAPVTEGPITKEMYIHAKLMIVDERYVLLGSANIVFTSLEFHCEMCTLVEDAAKAPALRPSLLAEHLCIGEESVPPAFADAADLWADQWRRNKAQRDAKQPLKSRVYPLSPLGALEDEL